MSTRQLTISAISELQGVVEAYFSTGNALIGDSV